MKIGCLMAFGKPKIIYGGGPAFEKTFIERLRKKGQKVIPFYSSSKKLEELSELSSILTAASLSQHLHKAKKCDILYATNCSGISYLDQEIPLVNVFHGTNNGILKIIGQTSDSPGLEEKDIWEKYAKEIENLNIKSEYLERKHRENIALVENFIAKNSKYLVAVSEKLKAEMVSYFHLPEDKIIVIENGITKQWFSAKKVKCTQCEPYIKRWKSQKKPVLIWVARIGDCEVRFKIKGLDRALEIMNHSDNVYKVVISFTPKPEQYQKLFASYGVEFISNWPYEHLPHLIKEADIFMQTSRYEGFGLTLIEAMASSLACISFPAGVATKIIKDGSNGFLVSNTNEMIEKIDYLARSKKERERLGKRAKLSVQKKYHIDTMTKKYLELFKKMKKEKKK